MSSKVRHCSERPSFSLYMENSLPNQIIEDGFKEDNGDSTKIKEEQNFDDDRKDTERNNQNRTCDDRANGPIVSEDTLTEVDPHSDTGSKLKQTGIFLHKIFQLYKWIAEQPELEKDGKLNFISFFIYILGFSIACIPAYDVFFYNNTYTDVFIKYVVDTPVPIPHAIICPAKSTNLEYDVWWNPRILKKFNTSNYYLNLFAEIANKEAFGIQVNIPHALHEYIFKLMSMKDSENSDNLSEVSRQAQNLTPRKMHALKDAWNQIVKVPKDTRYTYKRFTFDLTFRGNRKRKTLLKTNLIPIPTWVNKAHCILFESTNGIRIKTSFSNVEMQVPKMSRYWVGNISTDSVDISDFHTADFSQFSKGSRHNMEVVIFKDEYFQHTHKIKARCQPNISVNASKQCSNDYLNGYTRHIVHAAEEKDGWTRWVSKGYSEICFHFEGPIWHITRHGVYSWITRVEITISVFCLFVGFSFFQVLTLLATLIVKIKKKLLKLWYFEIPLGLIMTILAVLLLTFNLESLFSVSTTRKLTIGSSIQIPSLAVTAKVGLNFTKVRSLNISFELLQYIYIASIMTPMKRVDGTPLSSIFQRMHMDFWKHTNGSKYCSAVVSKMDEEYIRLANKMGQNSTAPAFYLLEMLHINKCKYIIRCEFNGKTYANCCEDFRFTFLLQNHLEPAFLLETSNTRNFSITESSKADLEIEIDRSVTYPVEGYREFLNGITQSLVESRYHGNRYTRANRLAEDQYFLMGSGDANDFINFNLFHISLRSGQHTLITVEQKQTPAQQKDSANNGQCASNTTCKSAKALSLAATNLNLKKRCGCFVCFSGMRPNVVSEKECCSPKRAVECIANPLLNVKNYKAFKCSRSEVECTFESETKTNCNANQKENELLLSPFIGNVGPGITNEWFNKRGVFVYPEHENLTLDMIRQFLLSDYNCSYKQSVLPACSSLAYAMKQLVHLTNGHKLASLGLRIDRSSMLNNYVQSRIDRQYSGLEAFGIILGGLGLFLGVDILSAAESLINYFSAKNKEDLQKDKLKNAALPIQKHVLRMFFSVLVNDQQREEFHAQINIDHGIENTREDQSGSINVDTFQMDKEPANLPISSLLGIAALCLFLTGIGLSSYVGTSNLLGVNELNVEVYRRILAEKYPSFAICTNEKLMERNENLKFTLPHFLTNNDTLCAVEMIEKHCWDLFTLHVRTVDAQCWITNSSSKEFKVTKSSFYHNEFSFILAIRNNDNLSVDWASYWVGNLQNVLSGAFSSTIVGSSVCPMSISHFCPKKMTVFNYHALKNTSCTNRAICPPCSVNTKFDKQECCVESLAHHGSISEWGLSCDAVYRLRESEQRFNGAVLLKVFNSSDETSLNKYKIIGYKRSSPYEFEFKEIPRHSWGANVSIVGGYIDLFLGLSVVSFIGASLLGCVKGRSRWKFESWMN